ncbi:Carbonic anhydrase (Cah) [Eupransor demetentiae]|uniref:carbonic anhydrase n=2 Tax=Eupransor demetentiae TaxID=3109584 RepID=A0ABM9N5A3_9LACO|nr:Carbonic anhydrase (Cah) [Lactobacillaceae bacterium LMG 33000]
MKPLDYQYQSAWQYTTPSKQQSPIDIKKTALKAGEADELVFLPASPAIKLDPRLSGLQFMAKGHFLLNGQDWEVERFHFHDGAEHTFDGQRYDMEGHIVTQRGKETMVIAFMGQVDLAAKSLDLPDLFEGQAETFDLAEFLPVTKKSYTYTGTLTTPPLMQGVRWYILAEPLKITAADLAAVHANYPANHRQEQPIMGRTVVEHALNLVVKEAAD